MADEEQDDHDSMFGENENDDGLSTHSLTSSILNYQYENGRRYHGSRGEQYFMPNDDRSQEVRKYPRYEQA